MRFNLMLDNPKDFYHEAHRAIHFLDFAVRAATNDENTTVDSEGFSGAVNNAEIGDGEENFTDPIFESELAEFKLRLAQTIEPVASTMTSQPE